MPSVAGGVRGGHGPDRGPVRPGRTTAAGRAVGAGFASDLPRKNCWTSAEWAGESSPHGMQHLLCRAVWDADAVRDDVREYVVEHLYDDAAVLVVDETGDVQKGTHTVGVQRQYTGTAGRIENSQVVVYLVYAGCAGTRRRTGSCTSLAPGRATRTAAGRPDSARTPSDKSVAYGTRCMPTSPTCTRQDAHVEPPHHQ
ncbi:transposase [Streptomyces sp. NPDC097107]|uniref:transposase n=1 Tax=Streptomyces sp. NPDC097107 TaxID=3366089 RepID=UPI00380F98DF